VSAAVIFGGPSPEHDISILTGLQAALVLAEEGLALTSLYWSKTGDWFEVPSGLEASDFARGVPDSARRLNVSTADGFSVPGKLRSKPIDVSDGVLVCCHGGPGEDGTLQGFLDLVGISYSGPGRLGAALAMDKFASKAAAHAAGVPTNPQVLLTQSTTEWPWVGPTIVKPRFGGSSIGIEVVDSVATAVALLNTSQHLRDGAVAEPYLTDWVDLNVAVGTWPDVWVSPIERPLRDAEILSYEEKYLASSDQRGLDGAQRELPADVSEATRVALEAHALALVGPLMLRGLTRLDFMFNAETEELFFNEANTIPGAMALYLADAAGVTRSQALKHLLSEAKQSSTYAPTTGGSDGRALSAAGSIAAKLS